MKETSPKLSLYGFSGCIFLFANVTIVFLFHNFKKRFFKVVWKVGFNKFLHHFKINYAI